MKLNRRKRKEMLEYYQDWFSVFILKVSKKIPLNFPLLNSLKRESEFLLKIPDYEICRKPEDMTITMSDMVYYDIIFYEDFLHLKNSILFLSKLCGDRLLGIPKILEKWPEELNERPGQLGDYNLGYFDFSKIKNIKYLNTAHLFLLHISPSISILTAQVKVSNKFIEEFQNIITTESLPLIKITKFNFRTGFIGWERKLNFQRRKLKLNKLLDLANSEMFYLRKKCLNFGNYQDISYPIIHVFVLKSSLDLLLENPENKPHHRFLESLGLDMIYNYYDRNERWFFLGNNKRSELTQNYFIITSEDDYKKRKDASHSSPSATLNYYINEFGGMMALNAYLEMMRNKIFWMRNYINPIILKKNIFFSRLKKAYWILSEINSLQFKFERIIKEIKNHEETFLPFIGIGNIKTIFRGKEYFLKADLINSFKYLLSECKNYLDFIKISFKDYITFRTLNYNHKIQSRIFWLTAGIIFLTIVLLFPEKWRLEFFQEIFKWIKILFARLTA